jgi:3-deoxy-D-arabino-heptulosonate 7-phosphate (DAHP) synthase class II
MDSEEKNLGGRPTKFKEEYCDQARKLCLLGFTDSQLAEFFEVNDSTIHKWKIDFPQFSESLKKGKAVADAEVAASLYKRATGYAEKETKVFCHEGCIITEDIEKNHPPDTGAAFIWLKNRQSKLWKDKKEEESSINVSINYLDA